MKSHVLLLIAGIAFGMGWNQPLKAQTTLPASKDTSVSKKVKKIYLNPGLSYISNLTYAGRRDSAAMPVLLPYLNLISSKGFYLSTMAYANLSASSGGLEGFSISPGYSFNWGKKWDGFLSATKYVMASSSSLILSSLQGSVDGGLNFKPHVLQVGLSADWLIGTSQDVLAGAELGKKLQWTAGSSHTTQFTWNPNLTFTAGTQSFYQTYYQTVVTPHKVPVPGSGSGSSSQGGSLGGLLGSGSSGSTPPDSTLIQQTSQRQVQQEVRKFSLLNISLSAPLNLSSGIWRFQLSPNLVFPVHGVRFSNSSSSAWVDRPFFYVTAGVGWLF